MQKQLSIPQALFLLARDDERGKPLGYYNKYIQPAGAITELVMMERLELTTDKWPKLTVLSTTPTGSPYLDAVLQRIAASRKPRTMQHWVSSLAHMKNRIQMIGGELVKRGIVQAQADKIWGIFPITRWPIVRPGLKHALKTNMETALFQEGAEFDERTGTLIALANAGHLLKRNFDRRKLRMHKAHIRKLAKGEVATAIAARKSIEAVQAAIAATAVVSASAVT
jgi:hypothetical protein